MFYVMHIKSSLSFHSYCFIWLIQSILKFFPIDHDVMAWVRVNENVLVHQPVFPQCVQRTFSTKCNLSPPQRRCNWFVHWFCWTENKVECSRVRTDCDLENKLVFMKSLSGLISMPKFLHSTCKFACLAIESGRWNTHKLAFICRNISPFVAREASGYTKRMRSRRRRTECVLPLSRSKT